MGDSNGAPQGKGPGGIDARPAHPPSAFPSPLRFLVFLALVVLCLADVGTEATDPSVGASLRFTARGEFKIVQFTDSHFGEDEGWDLEAQVDFGRILRAENPQLVVFSGDSVSGYRFAHLPKEKKKGWYASVWASVVKVPKEMGIPWAVVLGNHCSEADLTREEIVALDQTYAPLSHTRGRYYELGILGPANSSTEALVATRLLVFDSQRDDCLGVPGWGCVASGEVEWYLSATAHAKARTLQLNEPRFPEALAFVHIPLPEVLRVWSGGEVVGRLTDGSGVSCSSVNTGLWAAFKSLQDVRLVLHGHDHGNDFIGRYAGIVAGYGRKSGQGGYDPAPLRPGARVVLIKQHPDRRLDFTTWIRNNLGEKEEQRPPSEWERRIWRYPECRSVSPNWAVVGVVWTVVVLSVAWGGGRVWARLRRTASLLAPSALATALSLRKEPKYNV